MSWMKSENRIFVGPVVFKSNVTIQGDLDVQGDTTLVAVTTSGQVIIDVDSAEALLVREDGDTGDIFIVDTVAGEGQFPDDIPLAFGTSSDGKILWETADSNANSLLCALPEGGAYSVPVLTIGNKAAPTIVNADLGFFNGTTDPTLALISTDNTKYGVFYHDGGDLIITQNASAGGVYMQGLASVGGITPSVVAQFRIGGAFSQDTERNLLEINETTQTIDANIATARTVNIEQQTFTAGVIRTVTDAATLYVEGAPLTAGSAAITNPYALWVDAGQTKLDGYTQMLDAALVQKISAADETLIAFTADVQSTGATGNDNSLTSIKAIGTFNNAGQTLTNYYGLYSANVTKTAGIVNNIYGLYVENIINGSATNNAIYTAGGSCKFVLNQDNTYTIDAATTDHTGANVVLIDVDVNSSNVNAEKILVDVTTALSSAEVVNGLLIDMGGNVGDAADSEIHGIQLTSDNATGSTRNYAFDINGTWDYEFHRGSGTFSFATGDVASNTEIKMVSPADGDIKLSFYQTTSERAYILFDDTGNELIIDSDDEIKLQPNNTLAIELAGSGRFIHTPSNAASGSSSTFSVTDAAQTGISAATEKNAVDFNLSSTKTWAAGAGPLATQREFLIQAPTYAGNIGGALTITDAATVYIDAAPTAGANMTITNAYSLFVDAGTSRFDGRVLENQGADVASATNLTLGNDGNAFELTGTTKVDLISNVGWRDGARITLIANESVAIDHGTATSSTNITIKLAGAGDFGMTADDTLTLMLCSTTAGGQAWREVARTAI